MLESKSSPIHKAYGPTSVVQETERAAVKRVTGVPSNPSDPYEYYVFPAWNGVEQRYAIDQVLEEHVVPVPYRKHPETTYEVRVKHSDCEAVRLLVKNLDPNVEPPRAAVEAGDDFWAYRMAADAARWLLSNGSMVVTVQVTRLDSASRAENHWMVFTYPLAWATAGDLKIQYQPYFYLLPPL